MEGNGGEGGIDNVKVGENECSLTKPLTQEIHQACMKQSWSQECTKHLSIHSCDPHTWVTAKDQKGLSKKILAQKVCIKSACHGLSMMGSQERGGLPRQATATRVMRSYTMQNSVMSIASVIRWMTVDNVYCREVLCMVADRSEVQNGQHKNRKDLALACVLCPHYSWCPDFRRKNKRKSREGMKWWRLGVEIEQGWFSN